MDEQIQQGLGEEQAGGLGALSDDTPMGGEIAPPKTYTPEKIAPISPIVGKKISETATAFIGERKPGMSTGRDFVLEALGAKIVDCLKVSAERRSVRDEAIREYQKALALTNPDRESPLGEEGANIRTPLTWKIYNALHSFFLEACTGIRPYVKTEPMYGGSVTTANKIEAYYDGLLEEQIRFLSKMDKAIGLALGEGTSFIVPKWCRKVRMLSTTDAISPQNAPLFGLRLADGGYTDGKKRYGIGDIFSGMREFVEKDAPELDIVSYFDLFLFPADAKSPEVATIVGERSFRTIDSLRHDARSGVCDAEQLHKLETHSGLRHICDTHQTNLLLSSRSATSDDAYSDDLQTDIQEEALVGKSTQRKVEIFWGTVRFDGDGDELDETWVVCVELSTGVVLQMYHYPGGDTSPFQPLVVFDRPGKLYGMPLTQILDNLQNESDLTANLILDAAMLANTLIVEEGDGARSPLETNDLHVGLNKFSTNGKAGEGFKVHSFAPPTQNSTFPAQQTVEAMASDATAASETLVGRVSDKSGTTAFETNQALVAGSRRLKVGVNRIREAAWKSLTVLHTLCVQSYALKSGGDPEYKIPYPTRQGASIQYMDMTLLEFISPVRFFLLGDGVNTDKALQLQAAEKLYLMAERSPFIMGKMERMYAITADFLSAYNKKDYINFIGTVEEAKQMDADAAKQAENPINSIPTIDANAKPEQIAALLLKADPGAAQQYLQMLQAVYGAQEQAKAQAEQGKEESGAEQEIAQLELELKQVEAEAAMDKISSEMRHKLELEKLKLENQIQQAKANQQAQIQSMQANQQITQVKADASATLAEQKQKSAQDRTKRASTTTKK